jgi:beta-lactamase regulating signal transducer with metallopeptidase domain
MSPFDASRILLFAGEAFAASTLVMALAWLASSRRTASLRHLVWVAAFGAMVLLPLLAGAVPGRFVLSLPAPETAAPVALSVAELTPPPAPETFHLGIADAAFALLAVWLAGICLIALRSVIAGFALRSMRRDSVDNPFDESELPELASGREYALRVSNAECGPITWGLFRPVVLLPHKSLFWPGERLHAVLLHELAHVHRRDSLSQMLSLAACALYWPNPLVWLGARALRREAEMAADDAVLVSGMAPSEYAGELLHVAAEFRAQGLSASMPLSMAAPSALSARVQSVLTPTKQRSGVTSMDILKMAAVALLATSALVAARPSLAQDAPQTPAAPSAMAAPLAPPADIDAPPAPPSDVTAPVPPTPPSDAVSADRPVHAIHMHMVRKFKDRDGHMHVVTIDRDGDRDGDGDGAQAMAEIQPEIDHAMAQVKMNEAMVRAMQDERPRIEAEIRRVRPEIDKALAEARAQVAKVSDEKIRLRVDEALARAQAKLYEAQTRAQAGFDAAQVREDGHHRVIIEDDGAPDEK